MGNIPLYGSYHSNFKAESISKQWDNLYLFSEPVEILIKSQNSTTVNKTVSIRMSKNPELYPINVGLRHDSGSGTCVYWNCHTVNIA